MAGWEELTPEQIMTIAWIFFASVSMLSFTTIFRSVINFIISKRIQVKIEGAVNNTVQSTTIKKMIDNWSEKRRMRKENVQQYDIILEKLR